ncbi:lytic transglycosylase domain-containing protein [Qingshengfaniella alkalisoli]|uniref:Lytic transglycosylase domain-containing protein n=1 Tax=Qingshengfaniella alkalisoli TaxID=2599296 RepID=A0A5B8I9W6_9RHOB|nr:lytic transglycosylase domain-containing protein [Qingshengfaniella alkalisoli]QDY69896.1 lytic transglycosylase domain-containing protein [Qingshengfaniella alkalisoli]
MRVAIRRSVLGCVVATCMTAPVQAGPVEDAMQNTRRGDWDAAMSDAARSTQSDLAGAIVEWHRLRAGEGDFTDYRAFISDHPDWPGMPFLRERGEVTIPPAADSAMVLAYFAERKPQTGEGAMRLAVALDQAGDQGAAQAEAIRAWTTLDLSADQESVFLARFGQALAEHHWDRLDDLLWRGRATQAERMRPRVDEDHGKLMDARLALRADEPGVDHRIAAVPDELADDPGLAFERAEWRARKGRIDDLAALMLERSATREQLGRPEAWSSRRRYVARELMQRGDYGNAYLIAAQHYLSEGADFADLEWLAGYISLRWLDSPGAALAHFRNFRQGVNSPISLGRAGYWEGRAHEALDQPEGARAAYAFGAEFQTSFYGQLAAEKAGLPMDPRMVGAEEFPDYSDAAFLDSSVYEAGRLLAAAGEEELAARFFAHLAENMERMQIGQLAASLEDLDVPYIQLAIAKRAALAGHMLHRAYFPVIPISVEDRPAVAPEMALAIARRESEFNHTVISPAGARGLMQVMPGTASDVAQVLEITHSVDRLTRDRDYNALLGTYYLQGLFERFGNAPVLVAAGYNAGPGRPIQWMQEFGDPRSDEVDVVDWIESIPFRETRNYVMRVTESLGPYRARLAGEVVPLTLIEDLKGD